MGDIFMKTRKEPFLFSIESSVMYQGKICLPHSLLRALNIRDNQIKYMRLGTAKQEIICTGANNIKKIIVGKEIGEKYSILLSKKWQIKVEDKDTLAFGPFIGILVSSNNIRTLNEIPDAFLHSLNYEKNVGGCIFVFGLNDINVDERVVKGYTLKKYKEAFAEKYELPIPDLVYRRVGLSYENLKKMDNIFKENYFNSYYFSKYEFYKSINNNPYLRNHIPITEYLKDIKTFFDFLKTYKKVIIKPNKGTKGRGVRKIEIIDNNSFIWQNDQADTPKIQIDRNNLLERVKNLIESNNYIMQECIESIRTNDRTIDFRVIMQKNASQSWNEYYILAYDGPIGGVGSNHPDDGHLYSFNRLLQKIGVYERRKKDWVYNDLVQVCRRCCIELDKVGHYADVGIDVLIDKNFKPWIIEVNKRHDLTLPLLIGDDKAYKKVRETPIEYAVSKSGFYI